MARRALLRLSPAIAVIFSCSCDAAAQAPEVEAADSATHESHGTAERRAVRLGHDALALYQASRWQEAYDRFHAAEQLVHSPVFLLYMARCRRNAGKLLDAEQRFERLSRERVSDNAPAAWHGAVADAAAELIALRRAIPRVVVVLHGANDARVHLDGRELAASELGKPVSLDPGQHALVARDARGRRFVRSFRAAEGQATTVVHVSFDRGREARHDVQPSTAGPSSLWRSAGFVLVGVGAAGLGAGAGAAIVAANQDADRDASDWRAWSTFSLAAGGVVAGAGVLLLLLSAADD